MVKHILECPPLELEQVVRWEPWNEASWKYELVDAIRVCSGTQPRGGSKTWCDSKAKLRRPPKDLIKDPENLRNVGTYKPIISENWKTSPKN